MIPRPSSAGLRRLAPELACAALLVAVAVPLDAWLGVEVDEAFTLETTGGGVGRAVGQALAFELQPPLYFAALALLRGLHPSYFLGRLFSTFAAAGCVLFAGALSRRYLPRLPSGWLAALVAVNPILLWSAVQLRGYALVLLLAFALLCTFHDGWLAPAPAPRARLLHGVVAVLALYSQYYLGFLLVGGAVALLLLGRYRTLARYVGAMLLVGLVFLPLALQVPGQVAAHPGTGGGAPTVAAALRALAWRVEGFLLPQELPALARRGLKLAVVLAAAVALLRSWRTLVEERPRALGALLGTQLACFTVIFLITDEQLAQPRHLITLLPPLLALLLTVFAAVPWRRAPLLLLLALVPLGVGGSFLRYRSLAKPGDFRRVAEYLATALKPGEPVVVFHAASALALGHHYRGPNPIVPLPRPQVTSRWSMDDYAIADPGAIDRAVAAAAPGARRLWLVTDGECGFAGVDFGCPIVEGWVAAGYRVESDRRFFRARVRELRPR